ncbi:MAG: hypothetical protein ACO3P1_10950 [Pseudomonadales bacterium]
MSVLDQRKRFARLAQRIRDGKLPTSEQLEWLADAFAKIGEGADVEEALGLKRGRGKSKQDELARQWLDFALFWVASAIENGIPEADAFEKGVQIQRHFHGIDPNDPDDRYSVENLRRAWHRYPHMRRSQRLPGDDDSML